MKHCFFVAVLAFAALSGVAYSQTGQMESSTIQLAPIVATLQGWDTGITVVNTTDKPLTVTSFIFFSTTGEVTAITARSYTVAAYGRFSMLASELIGADRNGSLKFSVIGSGAKKAKSYQALYSNDQSVIDTIVTQELTSR
jgi:hypothetical protein